MEEIQLVRSATPFDLECTLRCGQLFRWEKLSTWWYGVVEDLVIKLKQVSDKLLFKTFPEKKDARFVANYLRLDDNLSHILSKINKDEHIGMAIQRYRGLRITRQDPWECLISYICATYKNIPAIKKMVLNLSEQFGKKIKFEGRDFCAFPKPEVLVDADVNQIRACKLGFRAKRVLEVSKIVYNEELDLESLRKMDYYEAKRELLSLPGVGQKVADCVLLFSLDKLEAFPVDIWVKRAVLDFYRNHFEDPFVRKISSTASLTLNEYKKINTFGMRYFGEYAGYAQEYLFALSRKQQKFACAYRSSFPSSN
jgi:N-glycosylase/DNA lyase